MSRQFVRHPASIPIHVALGDVVQDQEDYLKDISLGGLCFIASQELAPGTRVDISIPLVHPRFQAQAVVAWSRASSNGYEVGVTFLGADLAFRARMVEQVCHVEEYRHDVLVLEGRTLTSEEAALEWIEKYAPDFPAMGASRQPDESRAEPSKG
jgi:hypothetical protein